MEEDLHRSPQTIASRFLQRTIAGRDHARQCKELVVRLLETLGTIQYFGSRERNEAEVLLLDDMEHRGDTRRRATAAGGRRLQDLAVAGGRLEELVRHWEVNVLGRCNELKRILEEDASPSGFHDTFMDLARRIVQEVAAANWNARPPHPPPWDSIPSFFDENLFDLAKRQRTDAEMQTSRVRLTERYCWDGVPPRTCAAADATDAATFQNQAEASTKSASSAAGMLQQDVQAAGSARTAGGAAAARLNIACACIDDSDPLVTHVYLATERGMVFTMPMECLFPHTEEEEKMFRDRVAQLALRVILERRCRVDAAAAGLPTFLAFQQSNQRQTGTPMLDPSAIVAPPSPTAAPPQSSSSVDDGKGQQASPSPSNPNTFVYQEGPIKVFAGHVYRVNSLQLISHGERGKLLVTTSVDKTVRWFNAGTGALVGLVGPERSVCAGSASYIRSIDSILTAHLDGSLKLWDVQSGELVRTIIELVKCPIHACHVVPQAAADRSANPSSAAAVEPTLYTIVIGCRNGHVYGLQLATTPSPRVKAWNDCLSPEPAKLTHGFLPDDADCPLISMEASCVCRGGHSKPVVKIATLASYMFTGDTEGKVIKWDLDHKEKVMQFRGHIDDITALVATSDGLLFTGSKDGLFIMWDSMTGASLQRIGRHYHQIVGLVVGFRAQPALSSTASPSSVSLSPPMSPQATSPSGSTTTAPKKRRKKGGRPLQRATETPFPLVAKQFRQDLAGSRECVALAASDLGMERTGKVGRSGSILESSSHDMPPTSCTDVPTAFVLSISKDDSLIVWDVEV